MATIKNSSNQNRTISYLQEVNKQMVPVHITVSPGESAKEIPDVDALKAMTSKNPDWIGIWIPGDPATQRLLDTTKPRVEVVKKGGGGRDDNE